MRFLRAHILLLALYLFASKLLYAQPVSLLNYSIKDGLPSNEVYDVFQDKEGFMWFATDNGVVRFDGDGMKIFHIKDNLSDPVIFGFHEDPSGKLWFRSFSGKISYYDYHLQKIFPYKHSKVVEDFIKGGGILNSLYVEGSKVWISTNFKLGEIDSVGNLKVQTLPPQTFTLDEINKNFLLGFNPKDLIINKVLINNDTFPITLTKTQLANHVVCAERVKEDIFFSVISDVFKYSNGTVTKIFASPIPIISLTKDNEGVLWAGFVNKGSFQLDTKTGQVIMNEFLADKSITKTFQDRQGNYWFSTLENGVYFLPDPSIKILPSISNSKVKAVTYYNNKVIIGDQNGIIHLMGTDKKLDLHSPVICFYEDFKNRLWVSTNSTIYIFNKDLMEEYKIMHTTKVGFSSDGNFVWGAGSLSSRFSMDGHKLNTYHSGVYRSILVRDSLILLSGRLGFEVRNKKFELLEKPEELESYKITSIINLDKNFDLLATMGNGMLLMENFKVVKKFNSQSEFIADNIYGMVKKDSALWLATEKGLIRVDIPELLKKNLSITHLSKRNGLIDNKVNFLTIADQDIYAFSENGVSLVSLKKIKSTKSQPEFYLKSIKVNNSAENLDLTNLDHRENNLEISYGFLSFNNPEIFIRFRLSETEPWTYTQERTLRFFSLNPGSYGVQIEFSPDNHNWLEALSNLKIVIHPPWWTIWYVQLAILGIVLAGIWVYFKLQLKYSKQKQVYLKTVTNHQQALIKLEFESIEKERNRIAKDLHDGIGASLLTLKLMVSRSIENEKDKGWVEDSFQDTFSELKNVILDLSPPGLDRYGLLAGIQVYVEKIRHSLPIKIELYTFGEEVKDKKMGALLFRILQELLSNSIKHSNASVIKIQINSFKDLINIIFEDNGHGFLNDNDSGTGLNSIKFRIESLHGTHDIQSSADGISFIIDIPLKPL